MLLLSCARKIRNVDTFEIAVECIKMFGVRDVAEAVVTPKDRSIKRYVSNSSVVCEMCGICSIVKFF